jgi:hypothetical protein
MNRQPLSKSALAEKCCVHTNTIGRWLNNIYYEDLKKLGYRKNQKILTPKQWNFITDTLVVTD